MTRTGTRCLTHNNFRGGSIILYFFNAHFLSVNVFQGEGGVVDELFFVKKLL